MTCPICGGKTKVVNSQADSDCIYRERHCVECGHRFHTEETESDDHRTIHRLAYDRRNRFKGGK